MHAMKTCLIPIAVLISIAPLAVRAEEPPPAQADEAAAPSAEDLPYGAGYEARQRLAQERDRTESRAAPTETRPARRETDRAAAQRESRREARELRGQRGPSGH